jgi:hypothetical protein
MSYQVVKAFYEKLTSDSAFNTSLGGSASSAGRIFHGIAPANSTYPLAVFNLVLPEVQSTFADTKTQSNFTFRVDIFTRKTLSSDNLFAASDRLNTLLHKQSFAVTDNGTADCLIVSDGQLIPEEDFIRMTTDILVQCGP